VRDQRILATNHLDKSTTLELINNAGLNGSKLFDMRTYELFGKATHDKQRAAKNFDVPRADGVIPLH
jgi:hypothetical protein